MVAPTPFVWRERALSVRRIVTAFLFNLHGTAKILHVPHQPRFDDLHLLSLIWIARPWSIDALRRGR